MSQNNWKINKIKSLDDEVKELHPVLDALFRAMPQIKNVQYTQGSRENGADFVLVKNDELLNVEEYIGVVVKSSSIRQGSDDVHRQIKECISMPRPLEGKKSVYLTEVWIVTSKDITRNAEDYLHLDYRSTKMKFIDSDRLVALIDRFFPAYWDFANASVSQYVIAQQQKMKTLEKLQRILPPEFGRLTLDHEIMSCPEDSKHKFNAKKARPSKLLDEIIRKRLIFIEGGMGSGKSDLLLGTALKICEKEFVDSNSMVPYHTTYRELIKQDNFCTDDFVTSLHAEVGDSEKKIVIFIDGLDESQQSNEEKVTNICSFANLLHGIGDTKLVVASRPIDESSLNMEVAKSFDKFEVCQLTFQSVLSFVQRICDQVDVSSKLKSDLQGSPLMRALPRTPLSAILLGKLLKENIHELPSTLPELYSKYIELVLGRWDLDKGNGSEKEYETLQRLTAMLAVYFLDHDLDSIGVGELRQMFEDYLGKRRTGQKLDVMVDNFLDKSELISVDSTKGIIRFRHKTFAEFFYAHALFMEKGKDAPITRPFDENWHSVEYFYIGLVRDSPSRIERLAAFVPSNPSEEFIKLTNFGSMLMAAYQTPYEVVEKAVYTAFRDASSQYQRVVNGSKEEWLAELPELQILALFTHLFKTSYSYDFFKPALIEARFAAELDMGSDEAQRIVCIFLIDAVLATLKEPSAFQALVDRHEGQLQWAIRMGIGFAAGESNFINETVKRVEKKVKKSLSGNQGLRPYICALMETPIKDRKDIALGE